MKFWSIPSITLVSDYINPRITTYFNTYPKGRFGIWAMDFANSSRNELIIKSNFN
jgi:1-phosphatidylinositol phosphodiesterase